MKSVPLRRLIASVDNGAWGVDPAETPSDTTALCIRAADFSFSDMRVDTRRAPIRGFDDRTLHRLRLNVGDIVLEKSGGGENVPVGRSVLFDGDVTAVPTNFAARIRPTSSVDTRYMVYLLRHLYESGATARAIKQTTGIQNLDTDAWLTTEAPSLHVDAQRRIADFLDDRISRIDRIISTRREQLNLVEEVFQAWWNDQVGGLTREFAAVPLRRVLVSIVDGPFGSSLASQHYSATGTRVIRLGNIGVAHFRNEDHAYIPDSYAEELSAHAVVPGDLVMAGLGDERWPLGRCAVVPDIGPAIVKADCYRIRLQSEVSHAYAAIVLSSPSITSRTSLLSRGATRARLNTEVAREAQLVLAPRERQEAFVSEWRRQNTNSLNLCDTLTASVGLLSEYKTSLITAAVTGELDVTTAGSTIPG